MATHHDPYSASPRWLRANLHAHTCCGPFRDLSESGAIYAALGYQVLAVTDHNKPHDEARIAHWAQQTGLIVMPGVEQGATDHILELGVHEPCLPQTSDYAERAAVFQARGGFVIAAHPQEYPHGEANVGRAAGSLHAIEIYNGLREIRGTDELRNVALWDELLSQGARLWAVATDDFHFQYISPGHGWVEIQVPAEAVPDWRLVLDQLHRGAFYASTGPSFEQIGLVDGHLRVRSDGRGRSCLRAIGPQGRVLVETSERDLDWPLPADLPYVRVEIVRGCKRAWSQPFFANG